ncbi:MAG: 2-oxo acid dehydrogenase subunit E2 [Thaumarchaeota archaeon]|nr:2-oxo acid dehydrogenase subunit E2 [Nitrososphaerota archaeon]
MKVVIMPKLDLAMDSGSIVEWFKKEGESVKEGEPILTIMTQKVTTEITSPANGVLHKILAEVNEEVPVGEPIAVIAEEGDDIEAVNKQVKEILEKRVSAKVEVKEVVEEVKEEVKEIELKEEERVRISPAARKLAEEYGIDIQQIKGTGPQGRITKEDVLRVVEELKAKKGKIIPITGIRKIIAERMSLSHKIIPPVTYCMEVDATDMVAVRRMFKERENIDLSYNTLIIKAVAKALLDYPIFNSTVEGENVRLIDDINIGLAVATDYGLVVPIIHNADKKEDIRELDKIVRDLIERARQNKLSIDEVTNGTFIVTNLGMFKIDIFTPIIFPDQVAILGVGRMVEKPVVADGQIKIKPILTLSLTADHRVIDGALAATFLNRVTEYLEKISSLVQ